MKYSVILCCIALLWACSDAEKPAPKETTVETKKSDKPFDRLDLVEITGNTYREYYDVEKTKLKFEGEQDEEKKRNGKWTHYHENGQEASVTFYTHGIRNGYSHVKRPNGAMYYYGQYTDDKPSGVWKYYDEQGKLVNEHDYDKK